MLGRQTVTLVTKVLQRTAQMAPLQKNERMSLDCLRLLDDDLGRVVSVVLLHANLCGDSLYCSVRKCCIRCQAS